MLVSEVIDRCYAMFNEDDPQNPRYLSRAKLLEFVNYCTRALAEQLEAFVKYKTILVEPYKAVYDLPSDLYKLQWVWYDNKVLTPSSIRRWSENDSEWRVRTGTPEEYALDASQRNRIYLYKMPTVGGDYTVVEAWGGVVTNIWSQLSYIGYVEADGDFLYGETITGQTSSETASVIAVEKFARSRVRGVHGVLYLNPNTVGNLTQYETIEGGTSGTTAVVIEIPQSYTGLASTWSFSTEAGMTVEVEDHDTLVRDHMYITGMSNDTGFLVNTIEDNLMIMYSYYPETLLEADTLPTPYTDSDDIYSSFVLAQMYLVESVEQDFSKVGMYLQKFGALTGADTTKIWVPQRIHTRTSDVPAAGTAPRAPRLPDEY
jgi:hypothetical protein